MQHNSNGQNRLKHVVVEHIITGTTQYFYKIQKNSNSE